jgi:hydrogenase-4 transcriptional activator
MEQFNDLLLDVWRESSRHVEIGEAVAECAPALFSGLPIDAVLVRRIDLDRSVIETVATGVCQPGPVSNSPRTECEPAALKAMLRWCRAGELFHTRADADDDLTRTLVPLGTVGDVLAGPLNAPSGPVGVVLLTTQSPRRFNDEHLEMLSLLLDPFSVWLENDRRLRELKALREAAEADNRLLLARLGRHDISESIIGSDTGLKPVMDRVELVARADVPVLILGETGSGKEVVARAIHERSPRVHGPFLRVNCGAIPTDLVDSELFGHERGSFTGAIGDRKGWFERADGGTLFLDECGELPLAAQVRLLRILQDGLFERVGGERQIKVDVRVVAATHRNLKAMVAEGRFREDLWYRLSVFPLPLPPLRDRVEDIPTLARHFASRAADRLGMPVILPSGSDLNLLVSYAWPGNVRELAAVIERAVILGDGQHLEVAKALGFSPADTPANSGTSPKPTPSATADVFPTLDAAMARHIEAALVKTGGRIEGPAGAAALLDINPHTLRARMRKLGIEWNRFRAEPPITPLN